MDHHSKDAISRRRAMQLSAGIGGIALTGAFAHQAAAQGGDIQTADYSTVQGKNLWQVVEEMVGDPQHISEDLQSEVCFDTPFGRICVKLNLAEARQNQQALEQKAFGDVIQAALSTSKLRGACTTVCVAGVCVTHCW